jgi:hypothetical protein
MEEYAISMKDFNVLERLELDLKSNLLTKLPAF